MALQIVPTRAQASDGGRLIHYADASRDLDVRHHVQFLSLEEEQALFHSVCQTTPWYRVKYQSERHGNACTTPCWTNFYGGILGVVPHQPIPEVMQALMTRISGATGGVPFNAVLVRLYFDGQDEIAWHTDGRIFLGATPTIASLSLGSRCLFQMRKMTDCWSCAGTPHGGVDKSVAPIDFTLKGGDLLVMQGHTQRGWHHRVPKEKHRGPRVNINFRYIVPHRDETTIRGIRTFYKYMVSGDEHTEDWTITAPSFSFADIARQSNAQVTPALTFAPRIPPKPEAAGSSVVVTAAPDTKKRKVEVIDLTEPEPDETTKPPTVRPTVPVAKGSIASFFLKR